MKMEIKNLVFLAMSFILSSCSLLGPVNQEQQKSYVLDTLPQHMPKHEARAATILVMQPETRPIYNTTQMAYTDKPYQVSYFSENQWAETPSQMLFPLLVQSLQNTNYFHAVVVAPYAGKYEYMLTTQILQLTQNFLHNTSYVDMSVRVQLSRVTTGQLIATKQFSRHVPMPQKSPYGGVIAANWATSSILREISEFCVKHAH